MKKLKVLKVGDVVSFKKNGVDGYSFGSLGPELTVGIVEAVEETIHYPYRIRIINNPVLPEYWYSNGIPEYNLFLFSRESVKDMKVTKKKRGVK